MSDCSINNNRIAKNTLLLYVRMFLMMAIGLYTSRVNLRSLGVDNYGVYNAVAGFVVMFSAVSGSLGNAISRFIQVELGHKDDKRLKEVFSTSITIQVLIGSLLSVIILIVGIWFVGNKMQIPEYALHSSVWILVLSTVTFFSGLLYVPYYSCIIAHERMSAFAYLSIFEAVLKLLIAYTVFITPFDKLITFGFLLMANQVLIQIIYMTYCRRHFEESRFKMGVNKSLLKEMFGFVGWNMFSHASSVVSVQGLNVLINVFFGVVMNAARGIETQVNNAIQQFIRNFMTALLPPIMKSYAANDKEYSYSLVYKGDKYGYYLLFLLSFPILLETDIILKLWLGVPPEYSAEFIRWTLLASMTNVLGGTTLFNLVMADGRIKTYQIVTAILGILPFLLSWLFFILGAPVVSAYIITFVVSLLTIYFRLYFANKVTGISCAAYFSKVLFRVCNVSVVAIPIPLFIHYLMPQSVIRAFIVVCSAVIFTLISVYFVGLTKYEQSYFAEKIRKYFHLYG